MDVSIDAKMTVWLICFKNSISHTLYNDEWSEYSLKTVMAHFTLICFFSIMDEEMTVQTSMYRWYNDIDTASLHR